MAAAAMSLQATATATAVHCRQGVQQGPRRRSRRALAPCRAQPDLNGDSGLPSSSKQRDLEKMAQELIAANPEMAQRLERIQAATQKVLELQAEQARLAAAMAEEASEEAAVLRERQQILAANSAVADAEVRAAELLLQAAELEAQQADAARQRWAAEGSLDADRIESGKAAAAAGLGGALGSLPYLLASATSPAQALVALAAAGASSVLFGVTYRYAVRQDLDNLQLKGGVVAAFGLVRGVAQAAEILAPSSSSAAAPGSEAAAGGLVLSLDSLAQAALAAGQSMLMFAFASVALEFAFRQGLVKPLGGSTSMQQGE